MTTLTPAPPRHATPKGHPAPGTRYPALCAGRGGRRSSAGTVARAHAHAMGCHRPGQAALDGDLVGHLAARHSFAHERDQLPAELGGVLQRLEAADEEAGDAR